MNISDIEKDVEKCKRFLKCMEDIKTYCLEQMTNEGGCRECFYWCDKGSEEYHNCIFWRAGLGHPDKW